jgi:hypothetical protein
MKVYAQIHPAQGRAHDGKRLCLLTCLLMVTPITLARGGRGADRVTPSCGTDRRRAVCGTGLRRVLRRSRISFLRDAVLRNVLTSESVKGSFT